MLFKLSYLRVCWNRQTGTFEGRVSLTYGFKSHYSHQNTVRKWRNKAVCGLSVFSLLSFVRCFELLIEF